MPKYKVDYGEVVGQCEICSILLWSKTGGLPAIFPCNIAGCPYEDAKKQNRNTFLEERSLTGSGMIYIK